MRARRAWTEQGFRLSVTSLETPGSTPTPPGSAWDPAQPEAEPLEVLSISTLSNENDKSLASQVMRMSKRTWTSPEAMWSPASTATPGSRPRRSLASLDMKLVEDLRPPRSAGRRPTCDKVLRRGLLTSDSGSSLLTTPVEGGGKRRSILRAPSTPCSSAADSERPVFQVPEAWQADDVTPSSSSRHGRLSLPVLPSIPIPAQERAWWPGPGLLRGGPPEELADRARRLVRHRGYKALMLCCLVAALFLPDLWVLADRPSNSDLDVLLTGVLLLFLGELGAQSLGLPSYPGSFFFWMDLLGAASLLMDLSYLPLFSAAAGASQSVLLTARLAKLGARACRLGRLGKLMRFLPGLGASNGQPGMANAISMKLNKMLSLRICCVIILMVITMPLFGMWSFPAEDWSIQSWMIILETTGLRSPEQLAEQLAEFERFYADLPYFPFRLEHSFNGSAGTVWEPRGRGGRAPRRRWNAQRIERPKLKCDFNFSTPNRWAAAANLMQTFLIMILMVVFSYFLSNSVSRIVLKPLKGLLDRVVGASKQIFASVARMADTVQSATEEEETVSRAGSSASWRPRTARSACSDEAEAEAEAEILLLEEVLEKLAVVASYVMKRKDSEEDSKENEEIMAGFRSGHHSSPKVMTRMKSMALEVQMSMLQNVGLSLDLVNSWHLNPLELDKVRCHAACTFFLGSHSHGAELDPARLGAFITALEAGYQNTPYHSWFHAVDVTHGVYRLLRLLGCEAYLGSLERWALLVAASGHDLGHPGLKNQFLVDTGHELALLYNDRSPLENMHCTRLFEVLAVPRQDVLADLTRPQWQEVRQVCVEAILNTDNSLHFRLTQELQVFYEMNSEVLGDMREFYAVDPADFPSKESLEVYRSPEARQHFWKLLLHVSDLSNPTKPFRISRIWANRCIDEFLAQGDRERAAGLPVHALHDREKVDRVYSQLGFIEFLVAPLALVVVKLLPPYTPCVEQMLENLRRWQEEWFQAAPRSAEERRALDERAQRLERRFVEGT